MEERYLSKTEKKKKRKRNRRILLFCCIASILILSVFYLNSDLSKVKSLRVKNNYYYSSQTILDKAELDYSSSYILSIRWFIEHKLAEDPLIKSAKVSKDLAGGIMVSVEEEKIVGYLAENKKQLLIVGEGLVEYDLDESVLSALPRISGFSEEQLIKLEQSFESIDTKLILDISEILPYSTSYDENMVQLIMLDGNRISSSYRGVELLSNYKSILPQLEGTHVCLYMDEFSGNIFKENSGCILSQPIEEAVQPESDEIDSEIETQ